MLLQLPERNGQDFERDGVMHPGHTAGAEHDKMPFSKVGLKTSKHRIRCRRTCVFYVCIRYTVKSHCCQPLRALAIVRDRANGLVQFPTSRAMAQRAGLAATILTVCLMAAQLQHVSRKGPQGARCTAALAPTATHPAGGMPPAFTTAQLLMACSHAAIGCHGRQPWTPRMATTLLGVDLL